MFPTSNLFIISWSYLLSLLSFNRANSILSLQDDMADVFVTCKKIIQLMDLRCHQMLYAVASVDKLVHLSRNLTESIGREKSSMA